MSVMNETAIGLSDLLTQGNKMIAAWREALNDLEALLYLIERASGQKGRQEPVEDDSVIPTEMKEEEAAVPKDEAPCSPPAGTGVLKPEKSLEEAQAEARKVMVKIKLAGYREDMRALLAKRAYQCLTDVKDPEICMELCEEAIRFAEDHGIGLKEEKQP